MNFDQPKNVNNIDKNNCVDIKKEQYFDLVNDFGFFITLNASKLEHQVLPGKESELAELRSVLRKPIINGMNYSDFTSNNFSKLTDPIVSKAVISQIYNFLQYIEPRLSMFKEGCPWADRFDEIKQKYIKVVSGNK